MTAIIGQPIFITGTGRCGSTVFHRVLSYHPHLTWLPHQAESRPGRPGLSRWAIRLLDAPLPQTYVRKLVYPTEAYTLWNRLAPGFGRPFRDLLATDVTTPTKKLVRRGLIHLLTAKRNRLLVKITGWPRIGYLKEIFPDAKFIHMYRDGRAVANSWVATRWWDGWQGPQNWRWGELSTEQQARWQASGQSFVALAGLGWEILMDAHQTARQPILATNYIEVRYEDLCLNPLETFQQVVNFCGLAWTADFEESVKSSSFKNTNHKWQEQLTPLQQQALNECIAESLTRYGYAR